MSVSNYSVEDFVLDPEFKKWVLDSDPDAKRFWESFITLHPQKAAEMDRARTILIGMTRPKSIWSQNDEETLWQNISSQIDQVTEVEEPKNVVSLDSWSSIQHFKQAQQRNRKRAEYQRIAAISIFFLLLGLLGFSFWDTVDQVEETISLEYVVREAPAGVKSTISLPDGSKVMMNSGSSIRYEKLFAGDIRSIYLKGEAFFEVKPNAVRPFVVEANGVKTKAIGTSFNIKAYENELVFVSLLSGIVEVNSDSDATLNQRLLSGEGIVADPSTQNWRKEKFDIDQITAWMNKTISFEEISFLESVKILEQWYGVKISINGGVPKGLTVSGKFKDETLQNILEGLSYSSGFKYEISDKEVKINF